MKRVNIKYLVVSLTLILTLTLSGGCFLLPNVETSPPPTAPPHETSTPIDPGWILSPPESQAAFLPSIADVVAEVKPSVVAINIEILTQDLFGSFTQEGAGSGWIARDDGIIVTNNHVVEGAKSISVTLDDGRIFSVDMETVATDPLTDLAVLKIDAENLPSAIMGDSSELRVGDWVVAIGNSLGLGISATHGIVSREDVSLEVSSAQTLHGLIQTNAAINPGNSGGPLVNLAGEVVGITSAKISASGVEGMGYAISIQGAGPIIQELVNIGYVVRPWLGIGAQTVNQSMVYWYDLAVDKGALITYVGTGSPADIAGIKAGDVMINMNGKEISNVQELTQAIHSSQIGGKTEIIFWRGDTRNTTYATLTESLPP